eukprot:Gb_02873 [translate_table: standard]
MSTNPDFFSNVWTSYQFLVNACVLQSLSSSGGPAVIKDSQGKTWSHSDFPFD